MQPRSRTLDATIALGEGLAIIRFAGSTTPLIATVLGHERDTDGVERVYLDRLVHESWHDTMGEWTLAGAVSTILSRPVLPA